ncbi:hypothetical protein GCM10009754_64830 [Amycolatopsis minnesotensis]|uniref:DNA polymerase n=1 Tax=Amycolatopsis minnesotensis TaxID=337894 RepID=A0ABP5DG74_9PSEU
MIFLGATAAQSLLGTSFKITQERGRLLDLPTADTGHEARFVATMHPSAVLRAPDRETAYRDFLADLRVAAQARC